VEANPTTQPTTAGTAAVSHPIIPPASTPQVEVVVGQVPAAGTKVYRIPAKDMVGVIERAVTQAPLNLKVESSQAGVIETSYKEGYPGNIHIVRRWQERTKFRIVVTPDVYDPVNACRVVVSDITQERSNDRAGWQDRLDTKRPERAQEVIAAIEAKLGK
jgi:hypothetical protein